MVVPGGSTYTYMAVHDSLVIEYARRIKEHGELKNKKEKFSEIIKVIDNQMDDLF